VTRSLCFAVSVPNFGEFADVRAVAQLAREAEAAGWNGFFSWDHVQHDAHHPQPVADPWVTLTAVALATERMRIGTLITPLARRRAWKVARETVTLDHLSNGRFTLGVGLGFPPDADFSMVGEEADERIRGERLDEALDVITGLWRGEPFSYRGHYNRIDGATFLPRPVQQPRIPVWAACVWPNRAPMRRAARFEGIVPLKLGGEFGVQTLTPDEVEEIVRYVRAHRDVDAPFDVVMGGPPPWAGGYDLRAALPLYADAGLTWWLESCGGEPGSFAALRSRVVAGPVA
jgi:alkanesulfonate monooxygenase SsuD/methylene tetrahydromethanopterin reductase-like flavin-dependent oxidoreductase (luciferase family)